MMPIDTAQANDDHVIQDCTFTTMNISSRPGAVNDWIREYKKKYARGVAIDSRILAVIVYLEILEEEYHDSSNRT